jgi:prepilin-type N-terminal cleavage/methylation domain-containing protein
MTRGRAGGFTLLEVLLAVALGALLIVAANTFVLSMSELWGRGSEVRLFDQHVRGVTRFVENLQRQAVVPEEVLAQGNATTLVRFGTPAGYDGLDTPLLTFEVPQAPGACVWPGPPLPAVVCAWQVTADEGLTLLWQSRLEEGFGETRPRKTLVSPFVTAIAYEYFDADSEAWSREGRPLADAPGQYRVPARVRLTFEYDGMTREVSVELPAVSGGAPSR